MVDILMDVVVIMSVLIGDSRPPFPFFLERYTISGSYICILVTSRYGSAGANHDVLS